MAEESDTTQPVPEQVSETRLEPHALALIFPEVTGTDFDDLVADIKAHGLVEDIVTHEGKILDGRTRYKACMAAGVEPRYRPFERVIEFDGGPLDYVISKNLTRRHLTTSQRSAIAADLETRGHGGKRTAGQDGNSHLEPTRAEIAAKLDVSESSVAVAQKVKKASPELHEEVKAGRTSLNAAEQAITVRVSKQPARTTVVTVKRTEQTAKDPAAEPVLEGEILTGEIATPYTSNGEPETGPSGVQRLIAEMRNGPMNAGLRADESAAPARDEGDAEKTLYCSFCSKSQHEVRKLIAFASVFICDECVGLCVDVMRDKGGIIPPPLGGEKLQLAVNQLVETLEAYGSGNLKKRKALTEAVTAWTGTLAKKELRRRTAAVRRAVDAILAGLEADKTYVEMPDGSFQRCDTVVGKGGSRK